MVKQWRHQGGYEQSRRCVPFRWANAVTMPLISSSLCLCAELQESSISQLWNNKRIKEILTQRHHYNAGLSLNAGGWGFPQLLVLWVWPWLLLLEKRRKMEPKEIPSFLMPCLIVTTSNLTIMIRQNIYQSSWFNDEKCYQEFFFQILAVCTGEYRYMNAMLLNWSYSPTA